MFIYKMPDGSSLPANGKAEKLLKIEGSREISKSTELIDDLVCIITNPGWEAAMHITSQSELDEVLTIYKKIRWLTVPNAAKLADFN